MTDPGFVGSADKSLRTAYVAPLTPRAYHCQCGRPVFFRNTECLACHTPLGYDTDIAKVIPLQAGEDVDTWLPFGDPQPGGAVYRRCANFHSAANCNWLIAQPAEGEAPTLCAACRLNHTIPDLSVPENQELWRRMETAKCRMVSQLIALHLPVASKVSEDPEHGLAYDFLRSLPKGPHVLTGHDSGLITINIEEADDAARERMRKEMGEPYRTLLGHFRHEVGHYYWDRLVDQTPWLEPYRQLFGDERRDYGEAMEAHYRDGAPPDWAQQFVSSYASMHPWEDWAETWAHYLHMIDTVDTAASFGIDVAKVEIETDPFGVEALWKPDDPHGEAFLGLLNDWVGLTAVMNEMSRSMGQPDFYPFVLSIPAVTKLHFVDCVVRSAGAARIDAENDAVTQAPATAPEAVAAPG